MRLILLWVCLLVFGLSEAHEGGHDAVTSSRLSGSVKFGAADMFVETDSYVWHLERDIHNKENILFTDGNALKTTNGQTTSTIIGSSKDSGYSNSKGEAARFNYVTGFTQLDARRVVVVDNGNNCVRLIDRVSRTVELLVGRCGSYGYLDGTGDQALFAGPWSVIKDKNDADLLIVTDRYNNALRTVRLSNKEVKTLLKGNTLYRPRALMWSGNELWIAGYTNITKLVPGNGRVELIAGSDVEGDSDGTLERIRDGSQKTIISLNSKDNLPPADNPIYLFTDLPKFKDVLEIAAVDKGVYVIADRGNSKLKLLDTNKNSVSTLCGREGEFECPILSPTAVLSLGDNVYVGDYGAIRKISVCVSRNVTVMLTSNKTSVDVELSPGKFMSLSAGYHVYTIQTTPEETCTRYINVFRHHTVQPQGDQLQLLACPDRVIRIGAEPTNLATVTFSLVDGTMATITLPVGTYPYHMINQLLNCTLTVNIYDYRLSRRLEFRSHYDIPCDTLDSEMTKQVAVQAETFYKQLEIVCTDFCKASKDTKPILKCENDTLTIRWPTDVSYTPDIIVIPDPLSTKVRKAVKERGPFLNLFIPSPAPKVFYPENFTDGSYSEIILTPQCANGTTYDLEHDYCLPEIEVL